MSKVSVIISTYNGEKYIENCVTSILSQTFRDFEIIIVDDQSTDNTVKIVEKIRSHDERVYLYLNSCHNHSEALNFGLEHANGEYIALIDQDDEMMSTRLMDQTSCMDLYKDIDVCCSWFSMFGDYCKDVELTQGDVLFPECQLLITNIFPNPTAMIRKTFLEKHNIRYDCKYKYADDYAFWIKCALAGAKFSIIPQFLMRYRIHDKQNSSLHFREQYRETIAMRTDLMNVLLEKYKSWYDITNYIEISWNICNKGLLSIETVFRLANELFINRLNQNYNP